MFCKLVKFKNFELKNVDPDYVQQVDPGGVQSFSFWIYWYTVKPAQV